MEQLEFIAYAVLFLAALSFAVYRGGRTLDWIALALVAAFGATHILMFDTIAEDAFISYRYVDQFLHGNGVVFNESEHVEGYSNFLWMIAVAFASIVSWTSVPTAGAWLGALVALLALILAYACTRGSTRNSKTAGIAAALLIASSSPFAAYVASGMETALFALLLLGALWCVQKERAGLSGVVAGLATMTRPDGVLLMVALVPHWLSVPAGSWRRRLGTPLLSVGTYAAVVGPWTLWRLATYGYLVPNAIAAKGGRPLEELTKMGLEYLFHFSVTNPVLLVALGAALSTVWVRDTRLRSIRFASWFVVLYSGFLLLIGGDWMPAWRTVAPILPIAWVVVVARFQGIGPRAFPLVAAFSLLLFLGSALHPNCVQRVDKWRHEVEELAVMGTWFRETLPEGSWIAVYANGAMSFNAGTRVSVIDMYGLTDEHIARHGRRREGAMAGHAAGDPEYVLSRRPELIVLSGVGLEAGPLRHVEPIFAREYVPMSFRFPPVGSGTDTFGNVLMLRSRADELIKRMAVNGVTLAHDGR